MLRSFGFKSLKLLNLFEVDFQFAAFELYVELNVAIVFSKVLTD
jgi:hypothetical protein